MPAGLPYFAWIDQDETTFGPEHTRWDESVFSFECKQSEGDPANLTLVVRRPRNEDGNAIGLLGPGRKIWAWFAFDCGPALFKFRGRLVGIPTSIFEELVTLEFVARPYDVVAQKNALADTLRVLPYYDEVVIDASRRNDPEVVLEGYTAIWHYDRETHVLTVSDELNGEDGTLDFDGTSVDGKVLYDGLGLTLTSGPLSRVDVSAEYTWTQMGQGNIDLTRYLAKNWPGSNGRNIIVSYTLAASNWPQNGASLGDGWQAVHTAAAEIFDTQTLTETTSVDLTIKWWDGDTTNVKSNQTETYLPLIPPGSSVFPTTWTKYEWHVTYDDDGTATAFNVNWAQETEISIAHSVLVSLGAAYDGNRPCTERVTFSLFADVQHILTDPEDGEAMVLDGINSVNLSEALPSGEIPIGDPGRRSYIATPRGVQSFEHLIALARAHLTRRARVVEIAFAPKLDRMPEITLRKNVVLNEPRIGEATGKIIGYTLALDGSDGHIKCEVRIGCSIGRGGSVVTTDGTPTYCTVDYAGADYQQFAGRTVLFDRNDTSVAFEPPQAAPNDDGLELTSRLTVQDVIEQGLTVENTASAQAFVIAQVLNQWGVPFGPPGPGQDYGPLIAARSKAITDALNNVPTRATFKLKSMTREFVTDYDLQVSTLQIPLGIDLEAT